MTPQDQLVQAIEPWFDHVRTWVEVYTGQDLDPNHKVYDAVFHGIGLSFITPSSDDAHSLTAATPRVRPVVPEEWRSALASVAAGVEPPLEELLSRDARAAHRRESPRRAVIDAACAVEVALSRIIRTKADELPPRQAKRLDGRVMLGTLISIAAESSLEFNTSFEDLWRLNRARVDALHHGVQPSSWESSNLVQVAIDFLAGHGTFAKSDEQEPDGSGWTFRES